MKLLKTERLAIRPYKAEDMEDVFEIYKEKETCKYLLHDEWTVENRQEQFNKKLENHSLTPDAAVNLAVVFRERVIGDLSVWYIPMKDTVEIGYSFSAASSGRGYATEAIRSLISNLFSEHKVHRIQATLDARNISSQNLCERVGMRKEAHFMQDYWNKGEWTDSLVYGILHPEAEKAVRLKNEFV